MGTVLNLACLSINGGPHYYDSYFKKKKFFLDRFYVILTSYTPPRDLCNV